MWSELQSSIAYRMVAGFLALVLLAVHASAVSLPELARSASPPVSNVRAPFTKHVKHDLIKVAASRDRARARALVQRANNKNSTLKSDAQVIGVEIASLVTTYIAAVDVGSPPTTFFLIVDTGSSNTWVGATTPFTQTNTTDVLGLQAAVQYGSGFFVGQQITDQVDFGGPLVIPQQSISVASFSQGFDGVDGIVGIGPTGLTSGTVQNTNTVPTVTDSLFSLGIIPAPVVSVFFAPTNATFDVNGELVFGGIDPSAFTGALSVFPVTQTFPASEFFGVDASFVQSGSTLLASSGIVDTGTTLLLLATDAFNAYVAKTGAVFDNNVGLFRVTRAQFATLPTLNIVIGGVTFPLTPDGQRWPQQLNAAIGGSANFVYLIVSDLGTLSGEGFDFVLGQFFLERFYSVFDSSGFVALAPTVFTNAVVNN